MKIRIYINTAIVFLISALPAIASEEAGHSGPTLMDWVWKIVNFGVLVAILYFFMVPMLREFLRQRTELIKKSLDEAREARDLAQRALDEITARASGKEREVADIIAASRKAGEKEREALVKEGEEMGKKILEQAKANIATELDAARDSLRAEAVGLAMEIAEKKLRERIKDNEQRGLVEEALKNLEAGKR